MKTASRKPGEGAHPFVHRSCHDCRFADWAEETDNGTLRGGVFRGGCMWRPWSDELFATRPKFSAVQRVETNPIFEEKPMLDWDCIAHVKEKLSFRYCITYRPVKETPAYYEVLQELKAKRDAARDRRRKLGHIIF